MTFWNHLHTSKFNRMKKTGSMMLVLVYLCLWRRLEFHWIILQMPTAVTILQKRKRGIFFCKEMHQIGNYHQHHFGIQYFLCVIVQKIKVYTFVKRYWVQKCCIGEQIQEENIRNQKHTKNETNASFCNNMLAHIVTARSFDLVL